MPNQLLRYNHVRRADVLDDQKSAPAILGAETTSVTQENLQEFVLSQIKRIIFGHNPGDWNSDFIAASIQSLQQLTASIGTSFTPSQHEVLRQLIHFIDEGPATGFPTGARKQILPAADPFPTSVIWWEDTALTKKIVEKLITRNPNKTPSVVQWKMYAIDGTTVISTVTDTISYSGVFEINRIRTIV